MTKAGVFLIFFYLITIIYNTYYIIINNKYIIQ